MSGSEMDFCFMMNLQCFCTGWWVFIYQFIYLYLRVHAEQAMYSLQAYVTNMFLQPVLHCRLASEEAADVTVSEGITAQWAGWHHQTEAALWKESKNQWHATISLQYPQCLCVCAVLSQTCCFGFVVLKAPDDVCHVNRMLISKSYKQCVCVCVLPVQGGVGFS